ncbi:MAG: 2Fe-2S iron-sulfur cluster binding domain-containing protein [Pyrinomonadaceae bacterium]|nr:2Fe-2S iron-sulfur cluster binding domain-containing protein [Pyrinomonadaceae bacterium]
MSPSDQASDIEGAQPVVTALVLRRDFLKYTLVSSAGFVAATSLLGEGGALSALDQTASGGGQTSAAAEAVSVRLRINGSPYGLRIDPRVTLLDTLRENLNLTGTKKGCDHGQCGACTVIVDDRRVLSCLTLVATCEGREVTTIEGLAKGDELHQMQAAFVKHDGFQCGYCTPGQICSAVALLREARSGEASYVTANLRANARALQLSDEEIRERMSGNICRCGAYPNIVAAIREVHTGKESAQSWQFEGENDTEIFEDSAKEDAQDETV